MAGAGKIRNRLETLDADRYHRFVTAEAEIVKLLEYSQGGSHISWTPHGVSHVTESVSLRLAPE